VNSGLAQRLPTRRQKIPLTPLIDVVFILLVFFMLAANTADWRVITIAPGATSRQIEPEPPVQWMTWKLNQQGLQPLSASAQSGLSNPVSASEAAREYLNTIRAQGDAADWGFALIPEAGVDLQTLMDSVGHLEQSGVKRLRLLEPAQ
jgi:biopolymer transport protein ExbD